MKLASFSETAESTCRTFLSQPMHDCHREITQWLEEAGATVRIDAAGNIRGLYPAAVQPSAPRLLIGSHLDTVPNAGAFDGILGVVLAIALLTEVRTKKFPFAIEVLGLSEEEGVRFGTPFIGSRALVGKIDQELLDTKDAQGVSMRNVIQNFGLNPEEIAQAELENNALGYLEFHIEQGPVLEQLKRPLAAVESIAGQSRFEFSFSGRSNHAGTTPMHLRHDAIAGAAEWIAAVERIAQATPGLVATVGRIEAKPGAANVIAAEATLTLDIRHSSDEIRVRMADNLIREAHDIATRRRLSVRERTLLTQSAVMLDPFLTEEVETAIRKTGCESHRMVSGAGHDAMIFAPEIPSAMIFLRTPGGISHDPAESVAVEDVEKAMQCGLHLLDQLAASPDFYKALRG
jgi:allantoate deiminase